MTITIERDVLKVVRADVKRDLTTLVGTDCGHIVAEGDTNRCADGISGFETYCAGRCYEAHAASCPACSAQDAADYEAA